MFHLLTSNYVLVNTNRKLYYKVFKHTKNPANILILLRGLATLDLRVERQVTDSRGESVYDLRMIMIM